MRRAARLSRDDAHGCLASFRDALAESRDYGLDALEEAQWEQGRRVREMLAARGIRSVAAEGFAAPGVVVSYTDDPDVKSGKVFAAQGVRSLQGCR